MAINESLALLCIINTYGLFAVMTTKREEIVIEGSDDGVEWREYPEGGGQPAWLYREDLLQRSRLRRLYSMDGAISKATLPAPKGRDQFVASERTSATNYPKYA
jgi:hypothetical protein